MKKLYTIGIATFAGLTQSAFAASVADVIGDFPALVGQEVELDCIINRAQAGSLYCNTPGSATLYLYVDGQSLDAASLAQAQSACSANTERAECAAILVGTVAASFGSPIITNGSIIWTGGSSAGNTSGRGAPALQEGEYACYGNGSQVLAGLGFIASADGTYTDLDYTVAGSYFKEGSEIFFVGGHLGGETGRDLDGAGSFVIGDMAVCEPW